MPLTRTVKLSLLFMSPFEGGGMEIKMRQFRDVIGQQQIKESLQGALSSRRISHAYILHGEKGSGKEYIANIFAAALQCEEKGIEPCGKCISCKQAESKNHPDIITLTHEKPNTISVDDIREQINGDVYIKPYKGPYKIYIINEAEKMNQQAQNALLKTIEEPPAYVVILLLTSNLNALLQTVLSRCVVLNMKPVADELVQKYLMEQLQITDYQAQICVAFARGNIGKAKDLASSEDFENIKQEALSLLKYVDSMEFYEIVAAVNKLSKEYKLQLNDYLDIIMVWYRDVLLFKATNNPNHLVFRDEVSSIRKVARRSSYEGIEEVLQALEKAKSRISANVNFELTMELLFTTIREKG